MKSLIILLLINILFFISANILAQEKKYPLNTRGEVIPVSDVEKNVKPKHDDNLSRNIIGDTEMKEKKEEKVYYLHNGKFIPKEKADNYEKPVHNDNLNRNIFGDIYLSPDDLEDTLGYRQYFFSPNSNFGFFGQNIMIQWFEAPADMRILSVGMMCVAKDDTTTAASVKLVKFDWTMDEISNFPWSSAGVYLGYYEAVGGGFSQITAYLDDPERTGGWVDSSGVGYDSPFGHDLWSDNGVGIPFVPIVDEINPPENYNWIDMDILFEPEVLRFDVIGVSTKNLDPIPVTPGEPEPPNRIGWYANQNTGLGGTFKFYEGGRLVPGMDFGWWARDFIWDYVMAVVMTSIPQPLEIVYFTQLGTTISTEPRLVEAEITSVVPGGQGVAEALILYSTNGGLNWIEIEMEGVEPNFSGYIPGMPPGTEVTYKIHATDTNGNTTTTLPVVYNIFEVVNGTNLVILNGFDGPDGFPQEYYFGSAVQSGTTTFPYDVWAYGDDLVEAAALENYTNVFEIWNADKGGYNETNIRAWLEGANNRNYFLAGQEYLGAKSGYVDSAYVAGDFEYDILGIMQSYNDITYYYLDPPDDTDTFGDSLGTVLTPLTGTLFGDPLETAFSELDPPAESMLHNPLTILDPGDGSELNWQDAFDVVPSVGVVIDMNVTTKGIGDERPELEEQILPTLIHRELTAGNKIVFGGFDPLSVNTNDDSTAADFHWIGFNNATTPFQVLDWFGVVTSVEKEDNLTPKTFSLSQNYPNPFNPSTSIKFSIPEASNVVLKVYDILGSEVAVLVNEKVEAGNYTVNFDASQFASGMYIYSIKAGEFNVSKKMMLLK